MASRAAYPWDLSDAAWEFVEPLLPTPRTGTSADGRPATPLREVVNAILYLDQTGCSWRQLPHDFPLWRTVYGYFSAWSADGTFLLRLSKPFPPAGRESHEQDKDHGTRKGEWHMVAKKAMTPAARLRVPFASLRGSSTGRAWYIPRCSIA